MAAERLEGMRYKFLQSLHPERAAAIVARTTTTQALRQAALARTRVSLARIEASIAAGQARGLTPSGIKFYTDGSYEVLFGVTDAKVKDTKKPEGNGWNI